MPDRRQSEDSPALKVAKLDLRCAVLRIRAASGEMLARATGILPSPLPIVANRANGDLLWLAPGEWFLVDVTNERLEKLGEALGGANFHIADVTHGHAVFSVIGASARGLLARGSNLDLHPRAFPLGSCAQSLFAQIPAIIHFRSDEPGYRLYLDASHDAYTTAWLRRATLLFHDIETP